MYFNLKKKYLSKISIFSDVCYHISFQNIVLCGTSVSPTSQVYEPAMFLLTNFMKLSSSWEAFSCAATQEFHNILWIPKVCYRVHTSLPLVPVLSQISPVQTTPYYLFKIILLLRSHLHLFFLGVSFLLAFPPTPPMLLILFHSCYMLCPFYPPWLDHSNYTWRRVQVMKPVIMQFSPTSCHFIRLGSNIFISTLFSNTLSLCKGKLRWICPPPMLK
jgi:hypothetical protein